MHGYGKNDLLVEKIGISVKKKKKLILEKQSPNKSK